MKTQPGSSRSTPGRRFCPETANTHLDLVFPVLQNQEKFSPWYYYSSLSEDEIPILPGTVIKISRLLSIKQVSIKLTICVTWGKLNSLCLSFILYKDNKFLHRFKQVHQVKRFKGAPWWEAPGHRAAAAVSTQGR